ncbi:MAG: hypothetical protein K9K67_14320 [Bacteriovoracaceae bacterium]|nr:hypothetical protein [Bacteriovoracaceae bacterium]
MKNISAKFYFLLITILCSPVVLANYQNINRWGQRLQQQTSAIGVSIIAGTLSIAGIMFGLGNQMGATIAKYALVGGALIFGSSTLVSVLKGIIQ